MTEFTFEGDKSHCPSRVAPSPHSRVTLQEHFQLDMKNRNYTAQYIWDVLVAASVERISIEMASQPLEAALSGTMARTLVKEMLQDMGQLPESIMLMRREEKAQDVVERLLARGQQLGLRSNACIWTEALITMAWLRRGVPFRLHRDRETQTATRPDSRGVSSPFWD